MPRTPSLPPPIHSIEINSPAHLEELCQDLFRSTLDEKFSDIQRLKKPVSTRLSSWWLYSYYSSLALPSLGIDISKSGKI
jgi:hypothetical protein